LNTDVDAGGDSTIPSGDAQHQRQDFQIPRRASGENDPGMFARLAMPIRIQDNGVSLA
jgi:hypothetical protein